MKEIIIECGDMETPEVALELLGKHYGLFEGKEQQEDHKQNNLLAAIIQATEQEVDIHDVSELQ